MPGGAARPAVGLVEDFILTGDLNGNGNDEAVALLLGIAVLGKRSHPELGAALRQ